MTWRVKPLSGLGYGATSSSVAAWATDDRTVTISPTVVLKGKAPIMPPCVCVGSADTEQMAAFSLPSSVNANPPSEMGCKMQVSKTVLSCILHDVMYCLLC